MKLLHSSIEKLYKNKKHISYLMSTFLFLSTIVWSAVYSVRVSALPPCWDNSPPLLSVTSPSDGQIVPATFTMSGTASDPQTPIQNIHILFEAEGDGNAVVDYIYTTAVGAPVIPGYGWLPTVSGSVVYDGSSAWSANSLGLIAEGTYDVTIVAANSTCNFINPFARWTVTDSQNVVVDATAPEVSIAYPVSGFYTTNNFTMNGSAFDAFTDIDYLLLDVVEVDGIGGALGSTFAGAQPVVYDPATDTFNVDLLPLALPDGFYRLLVTAFDMAGNENSAYVDVEVDTTAPVVTFNKLTTTVTSPALTGTVDDPEAVVGVKINGVKYLAVNNGNGTWTLPSGTISPALALGTYDVTVFAEDALENGTQKLYTAGLVITAPAVLGATTTVTTTPNVLAATTLAETGNSPKMSMLVALFIMTAVIVVGATTRKVSASDEV